MQKQKISNRMEKIVVGLFLVSFLLGSVVPLVADAQTGNCCKIKRSFSFAGETWSGGTCYGEVAGECVKADGSSYSPVCTVTSTDVKDSWGTACILNTVYKIVDLIFALLIVIAVVMGLAGAYNILTAGGAAEKVNKGRDLIIYAIIGVIVAFFARAIPSIIAMLL